MSHQSVWIWQQNIRSAMLLIRVMWMLSYFGFRCRLGFVSQSHPQTSSEKYTCTQTTSDMCAHVNPSFVAKRFSEMSEGHDVFAFAGCLHALFNSLGYMLGVLFYIRSIELALTVRRHATDEVRNASRPLWRNPPQALHFKRRNYFLLDWILPTIFLSQHQSFLLAVF